MLIKIKNNLLPDSIAAVVILLMAIGTVFVYSADANLSQELNLRHFYNYQPLRQILFFPLAIIILYSLSTLDYHHLSLKSNPAKSPITYLLILSIALLIIVLLPGIGTEINQARRWLRFTTANFTISFQPSELAKWTLVFFIAAFCDKFNETIHLYRKRFLPLCAPIAIIIALIITEDFGTAVFLALLAALLLLTAGAKLSHILTPLPLAAIAFFAVLIRSPARLQRIAAFLNPQKWADSAAYQANQSLIALGSGGIFGKGLGRGICKYGHLPEDTTDFIFAIIGEELGLIGTTAVILLFIIFVWLGILVVIRAKDRLGRLLAASIVLTIATQAALNIGVVTVVLPTKGIPLPFVSAGGTSMLLSAAAVGILLNIAKQSIKTVPLEQ